MCMDFVLPTLQGVKNSSLHKVLVTICLSMSDEINWTPKRI